MSVSEPRLPPHPSNKTVTGDPRLKVVSCRIRFLPYSRTGPAPMNLGSLFAQVLGWALWTQTPDWFLWSQAPGLPQIPDWLLRTWAHGQPVSGCTLWTQPSGQCQRPQATGQILLHQSTTRTSGARVTHGPKCQPTLINPSTSPAQPLTQAPGLPT